MAGKTRRACGMCGDRHDCPWCKACDRFFFPVPPRPPSDPVTVAADPVPDDEAMCNRRTCMHRITQHTTGGCTRGCGCPGFVPIDTARSVPPGPVPVEAPRSTEDLLRSLAKPRTTVKRFASELKVRISRVEAAFAQPGQEQWVSGAHYIQGVVDALLSDYDVRDPADILRPTKPAAPPAAPVSEPAVRLLSVELHAWANYRERPTATMIQCAARAVALEAELAGAKHSLYVADVQRGDLGALAEEMERGHEAWMAKAKALEAEVEQLRGKLAEGAEALAYWAGEANQATSRVRSMREACDNATAVTRALIERSTHVSAQQVGRSFLDILAGIKERLPLDTGTATDTGGEETQCRMCGWPLEVHALAAQADAIKAAVDKANNRAADAFRAWRETGPGPLGNMHVIEFEEWLRSGEDAPGAVGK